MKPERWAMIEQFYHDALERKPDQRAAFLLAACPDDADIRRRVEVLLRHDAAEESFIEQPALLIAARQWEAEDLSPTNAQTNAGQQLGAYQILALLGRGGMGEVHLALDPRLGRKVAVKLLPAEFTADADRVRRFAQEARAASSLNHPNIITIHEIGAAAVEEGSAHYIVTEYIEGETLRQRIASAPHGRIEPSEAIDIARQIAAALSAAHKAGITHRDIKPENVMVRRDGIIKVLDFGLAKLTEGKRDGEKERLGEDAPTLALPLRPSVAPSLLPSLSLPQTNPGVMMGTPRYMSPEQARGEKVDARTDIFSLGVMFYEMVTGSPPFAGATTNELIAAILKDEPLPLTFHAPDTPPELERIVGQALGKNREERYQNADSLLADLKQLARDLEFTAEERKRSGQAQTTGVGFHLLARPLPRAESLAVLPFSGDPQTEYLSDGLAESLINNFSSLSNLRVIARATTFSYKGKNVNPRQVGQELNVSTVMTGRVTLRDDNLIVQVELVDAATGAQIWGDRYLRKLSDIFELQEEIAKEISEKLRLKLTGAEQQQLAKRPTENLQAFQYYMQGRQFSQRNTHEHLLTAIGYYKRALEEDRNYALAYAGLADAYSVLGIRGYLPSNEARRKAEEAARKALALDENLAEAHAALGLAVVGTPYDFPLEEREERRAIELSPSLAVAHYYLGISLVRLGRFNEGLAEMLQARALDPLSPNFPRQVAQAYYNKRDYARALALLRQADELGPAFSVGWEIGLYIQTRLFDEALAGLEKEKQTRKSDPILIYSTGMVYAARGKRAEAIQVIKELEAMSGASLSQAVYIAKIYAVLNEQELVLSWLERGLAAGTIGAFLKDDPVWDMIRSAARFGDLMRRMGFPQ